MHHCNAINLFKKFYSLAIKICCYLKFKFNEKLGFNVELLAFIH